MKREIRERRRKLIMLVGKGVSLINAVSDLAREYNMTKHGVYVDWARRDSWIEDVVGNKTKAFQTILINNQTQVLPNAWKEYLTAPSSKDKLNALRLILDTNSRIYDMLQSKGDIPKVKEQSVISGELTIKVSPKLIVDEDDAPT